MARPSQRSHGSALHHQWFRRGQHLDASHRELHLALGMYAVLKFIHAYAHHSPLVSLLDGMFTILVPVSLSPLVFTLFWAERKARRLGLVEKALGRPAEQTTPSKKTRTSFPVLVWRWAEAFDLIGLVLLVVAVALILVPLTLSSTASHGWHNGR